MTIRGGGNPHTAMAAMPLREWTRRLGALLAEAYDCFMVWTPYRHRITLAVGSLQLRQVARDALVDPLKTPFHLGLGEVLIARIDRLEFGTVDGDARHVQQIKLAAQRHEGTADLTNRLAVVLAEIRNGLEVRRQLPRQPDQLDVALAFALKAAARRNAIEIAINIYLEQGRRMIARPPLFQRLNPTKAKLAKIKTFNESVNRTNQIVLGPVVVKQRW